MAALDELGREHGFGSLPLLFPQQLLADRFADEFVAEPYMPEETLPSMYRCLFRFPIFTALTIGLPIASFLLRWNYPSTTHTGDPRRVWMDPSLAFVDHVTVVVCIGITLTFAIRKPPVCERWLFVLFCLNAGHLVFLALW